MKDTVAGRKSQGAQAAAPKRFIATCNAHYWAQSMDSRLFRSKLADARKPYGSSSWAFGIWPNLLPPDR